MSILREEIHITCPVSQAGHRLDDFFREYGRLTLRVPLAIPGLRTEALMQRDVHATITRVRADAETFEAFLVNWEAIGSGPFPRFNGKLSVKGDEDYDSFRLVLDGHYDPPLGSAGDVFDAVLGRWIAIGTARDLLERVRDSIEAGYRLSETEKLARREAEIQSP